MDKELQALIDAPIDTAARANRVWLPAGKRPAPKAQKMQADDSFAPAVKRKDLRAMADKAYSGKLVAVLDYYATTSVPFERIAEHVKLDLDKVSDAMKRRGREA